MHLHPYSPFVKEYGKQSFPIQFPRAFYKKSHPAKDDFDITKTYNKLYKALG